MIIGIGIDAVDIYRFNAWHTYSYAKLNRIFSREEITYCLSISRKSAERFAVRFAAREAFFKALSNVYPNHAIPFLTLCKAVQVSLGEDNSPFLGIQWQLLKLNTHKTLLSLTHTSQTATAIVAIE